jgi:hypothetical protein
MVEDAAATLNSGSFEALRRCRPSKPHYVGPVFNLVFSLKDFKIGLYELDRWIARINQAISL